jgi:DNA helicase-2/ATP-dependent DNA helicase PcrA
MTMLDHSAHIETDFADDFDVRAEACAELQRILIEAPVDTRNALASFAAAGDEHQQRVIQANELTVRLVAPAGSGKTQTVVHRVLSRIRDGIKPSRIVVLTFDNSASSSLKSKLDEELTRLGTDVKGLTVSTLNAYGYGLLREHFNAEYRPIAADWRTRRLIRECRKKLREVSAERAALLPGNLEDRFYLAVFSVFKNQIFDPRALQPQTVADFMLAHPTEMPFFEPGLTGEAIKKVIQGVIWLYQRYNTRLSEENMLDFDDQKLRAYRCLTEQPGVLEALQNRYSEVIVDEFQDINRLDFEFIKALASKATLVVTGDDDQAIYGFRGCTPEYIIELEKHLERTVTPYELKINYRSPPNIVEHAAKLISHNTWRIAKQPVAHQTTPSQIKVVSSLGAANESKWIVDMIHRLRHENATLEWANFAVLYRTNAQSLAPQIDFVLNDIPYHVRKDDNIMENEALEKLLGTLRLKLALDEKEEPTPRDCLLTTQAYFRFLTGDDIRRVSALLGHSTLPFGDLVAARDFAEAVPRSGAGNFAAAVADLIAAPSLMNTLDVLAQKFKGLRAMIGSLDDVLEEKVPLGEIYEIAANFKGDSAEFVATLERALGRARAIGAGNNDDGVALRTYFKSKGLQWHTVFLISCNDGVIPHKRSIQDPRKLEEERRLFYVAMTRASANLVISYVKNVAKGSVAPSRFITEAGLPLS